MELLTLFAKKEPTTDAIAIQYCPNIKNKKDTVLYRDRECTQLAGRWSWYHSNCPRRSQKKVMFNCWPWKLEWIAETNAAVAK